MVRWRFREKGHGGRPQRRRAALLCGLALLAAGPAQAAGARRIDLVLALDTTGSMSGLIDRAKAEIWGVVDRLAAESPTPDIRIGLVAFRDRGDEYVTRRVPLSRDIDAVYGALLELRADGGGDGPESVNQALHEAVTAMEWAREPGVERVVLLAGDAPPHMDYEDDVPWFATVRVARSRAIAVHAVQCGNDPRTRRVWESIASQGGGAYAALPSSPEGARTTPWDGQLAEMNRMLSSTLVPFGDEEARRRARASAELAGEADDSTAAARASYLGRRGGVATGRDADLVAAVDAGRVDWRALEDEALPEIMRDMSEADRLRYLDDQRARRTGLLSEIAYLSGKRDAWLREREGEERGFQARVLAAFGGGAGSD